MPKTPKPTDLNAALKAVSNPLKGRKPNKPKKLPQKKRSKKSKNVARKVKETTNLALITKAIVREGGTIPDIEGILGCESSEGSSEWLERLKAEGLSLAEFLEIAKQRADIELIRIATKTALGYEYEEEKQEWEPVVDSDTGLPTGKFVPGKKTVNKKRERDTALLKFLLTCRMPQWFMDRKEITIDKRVVEIKADAKSEISGFCAGVLKAFGGEVVEAEFVGRLNE